VVLDGRVEGRIVPMLATARIPTAVLANPNASLDRGMMDADFFGGAFEMVNHLIGLGHRRIAHVADHMHIYSSFLRRDGYLQALREAGIEPDPDLVLIAGSSRAHGYEAAKVLFERDPSITAMFCVNDLTAFGVMEFARERGISVPGDLSVTGYDDISLAKHATPPLTTIHIPWYEMAALAVDEVIAVAGSGASFTQRTFPVQLCIRETTGPARSRAN